MEKITLKYNKKPIVGDLYTLANLKILLDDLLNEYLTSRGRRRSYVYVDIKNAIGIVSMGLAAAVVFLSVYCRFQDVKFAMSCCLALYFVLYAISLVAAYLEGNKFYYDSFNIVTRADDVPVYVVLVYVHGQPVPLKYTKSILDLFDERGHMDHELFLRDLEDLFNKH